MAKMFRAANAHDTDAFMATMVRSPKLIFAINGEVSHEPAQRGLVALSAVEHAEDRYLFGVGIDGERDYGRRR